MDTTTEIEQLDRQIAANEHAIEATGALREKREKLQAAQQAEQEARRREAETKAAAQAVQEAEVEARRAEAAPLRAELGACDRPLVEIEQEVTRCLWKALADARGFHRRYVQALTQRNAVASRLNALGEPARPAQVLGFEAFVRSRLSGFDNAGRTASGAAWAHEEGTR